MKKRWKKLSVILLAAAVIGTGVSGQTAWAVESGEKQEAEEAAAGAGTEAAPEEATGIDAKQASEGSFAGTAAEAAGKESSVEAGSKADSDTGAKQDSEEAFAGAGVEQDSEEAAVGAETGASPEGGNAGSTGEEDLESAVEAAGETLDEEPLLSISDAGQMSVNTVVNGLPDQLIQDDAPFSAEPANAALGDSVTVTARAEEGYYLAQIRLSYEKDGETVYEILDVADGSTSFVMPADTVTVYADYIAIVWDGTIDLTWFDPDQTDFEISYAAQFEGVAALCNGLFNDFPTREVTIDGSAIQMPDLIDADGNALGLNETANNKDVHGTVHLTDEAGNDRPGTGYEVFADLDGDGYDTVVVGDISQIEVYSGLSDTTGSNNVLTTNHYWFGGESFYQKQITLAADLDMGGSCNGRRTVFSSWSGPNYMPLGGAYSMDPDNGYTRLSAGFNGTLDGDGHMADNVYASRHVTNGFGNCEACGLIGMLGSYRTEFKEQGYPAVKNIAVDGFIYGNRMVGGIVGETYHSYGSRVENCINFATIYNTDAKGCGGIIGNSKFDTAYGDKQVIVENCVNFGYVCTGYNKNAGGLIGSSEARVFDCYTIGFTAGEGKGNEEAGNIFGTNNGGAVWYNCYGLNGAATAQKNKPGTTTPLVYGSTAGSAMRMFDSVDPCRDGSLLSLLNGKVRSGGTDENGYMDSDDDVLPNTKRNWAAGQETSDQRFVSGRLAAAMRRVTSWHDPSVTLDVSTTEQIAAGLSGIDVTGMPIPIVFMKNRPVITKLVSTGTPTLAYLSDETFDTGDHENQSVSPEDTSGQEYAIWAIYDDGGYAQVEDYEVIYQNGGSAFEAGDTQVTVSAESGGRTLTESFDICVTAAELIGFKITANPDNILYETDAYFDPTGMVITAAYGSKAADETEEDTVAKTIKAYFDGADVTVKQLTGTDPSSGKDVYTTLSDEASRAYHFCFEPDVETRLDDKVTEVVVSHSYGDQTLTAAVAITVLSSKMPKVVNDGENQIKTVYIGSADDFLWFANQVAVNDEAAMHAELEADLDLTDRLTVPVGIGSKSSQTEAYQGIFNGNGHSITVNMDRTGSGTAGTAGLFYMIGAKGQVNDLILKGQISGNTQAGGIAVYLSGGAISGCSNQADIVSSTKNAGGIIAETKGKEGAITSCANSGSVTACFYAGGIAGSFAETSGSICACENSGSIRESNRSYQTEAAAGGIVGSLGAAAVSTSKNTGQISGIHMTAAGGIAGRMISASAGIASCYNTGAITAEGLTAVTGTKSESYDRAGIGGIAGRTVSGATVTGCYSTGEIREGADADTEEKTLPTANSLQTVLTAEESGSTDMAGALIGQVSGLGNVTHNYALEDTSSELFGSASRAAAACTDENGCFVTSDELQAEEMAALLGEDYRKSDLYPVLSWEAEDVQAQTLIGDCTISEIADQTYCAKALMPAVTIRQESRELIAGTDYTVSYSNNVNAGTASVVIRGMGDYTGQVAKSFRINKASISSAGISGISAKTYSGKAITQTPVVRIGSIVLKAESDYTVTYENNTNAGTATIKITGKGNYTGMARAAFVIRKASNPLTVKGKTVKIKYSKLKKKKQAIKISKVAKISNAKGAVTYKLSSAKKGSKSFKSKFKVNTKTGKIIVKKGTKKGTYKVKIKVTAKGNTNYSSKAKTVTVKVQVVAQATDKRK